MTCTGANPGGIGFTSPSVLVLNINSLTGAISVADRSAISLISPPIHGADGSSAGESGKWAGAPGNVTINYDGGSQVISTTGENAIGIYASSIGGNGGDGEDDKGVFSGSGGHGGGAAGGGSVVIVSGGTIRTTGHQAHGIVGESIGGSGGSGGKGSAVFVGKGGDGGAAAGGGSITITSKSNISTKGEDAVGIFAQSVGGDGGAGGDSGGIWSSAGGGSPAAPGGAISITNSGKITTAGAGGDGIFVQSIGGFGGDGGNAGGLVAYGASGASAGSGGNITVNNTGVIITENDVARGLFVQSIGGGGGQGGSAMGLVGLGGNGALGGDGGNITINNTGAGYIETAGEDSDGIFVQSIGGGGGDAGDAKGIITIGGRGGKGGNGGAVTVVNQQNITTQDHNSKGVYAQSIGGGGGNGGSAVSTSVLLTVAVGGSGGDGGHGGAVKIENTNEDAAIETDGDFSHAIMAQSIGGGGGTGSLAVAAGLPGTLVSVSLGGGGGDGGNSGTVIVNNASELTTHGKASVGVLAQSIGGGGGNGGFSFASSAMQVSAAVAIGGGGGLGGSGNDVTLHNSGAIRTFHDLSYGLQAQSIGGGGGNGGSSVAAAVGFAPQGGSGAFAVAIGGSAGDGGNGEAIELVNSGNIRTGQAATKTEAETGANAHAIFAQSIGGGGGAGGYGGAATLSVGTGVNFALGIGGTGGHGGDADVVDVDNTGNLTTAAAGAYGIFAQSIGGGGGDGGFGLALSASSVNSGAKFAVALGGSGGAGGKGGEVWINNDGLIRTSGKAAVGIKAQSIGGGGGSGGYSVTGMLNLHAGGASVGVSIGGSGGSGNIAGNVHISNSGGIQTQGADAVGILVQSIGGGGGDGGLSVAGGISGATTSAGQIGLALGGNGGSGNSAGAVAVVNENGGAIRTTGYGAHGIQAQSIGGGGGKGGLSVAATLGFSGEATSVSVGVSIGGKGGSGGLGGTVNVSNADTIRVLGSSATGIFAQSVGGGGGDGGGAVTGLVSVSNITESNARTINVAVAVGGKGGNGNNGGAVTVANAGRIETGASSANGDIGGNGHAIFAQSVGGGGGVGGRANAINVVAGQKCTLPGVCEGVANAGNNLALTASVGGDGGSASHGGAVSVTNTAQLVTWGNFASGIYAQSVGGGGGDGGNGILGASGLLPEDAATATAAGFVPFGTTKIYKSIDIAVGGSAGASGNGGSVTVANGASIVTHGIFSDSIFAQSVGGGGGVGGLAVIGLTGKFGLGGAGGAAGDGGNVSVSVTDKATLETFGDFSYGIFAQSVGGGGGRSGSIAKAGGNASAGLGLLSQTQSGGNGGNGGSVKVDVVGNVITRGMAGNGIFAQSVGGGGGVQGDIGVTEGIFRVGSAGDAGDAGTVSVALDGNVMATGDYSTGIFAQSAAGTGRSSAVAVTVKGQVNAASVGAAPGAKPGLGSIGILAQSTATAGRGNINVTINGADSAVLGGRTLPGATDQKDTGIGVLLVGGTVNTIENHGLISTADGAKGGYAILAKRDEQDTLLGSWASNTVNNFGTITGVVDLGLINGVFNNKKNAVFNTGAFVSLGGGYLFNEGIISPGGSGSLATTQIGAIFNQSATGVYLADIDQSGRGPIQASDLLAFTDVANMAGVVRINFINAHMVEPGRYSAILATAPGTLNAQNLSIVDTAAVDYTLSSTANELRVDYNINLAPGGLLGGAGTIGNYLTDILIKGDPAEFAPVIAGLLSIVDPNDYAAALRNLGPEAFVGNATTSAAAGAQFTNAMMSCKQADGPNRFDAEGECYWSSLEARHTAQAGDAVSSGYDQVGINLFGGAQMDVGDHVQAGLAVGIEQFSSNMGQYSRANGIRMQGGAVLKAQSGNASFAAALNGGIGLSDVTRVVDLPGAPRYVMASDQTLAFVSGHVRAAYTFEMGDWYLKPGLDIGLGQVVRYGFTETGSPLALRVGDASQTYITFNPSIEVGGEIRFEEAILRPFARAGIIETVILASQDPAAGFASISGVAPFSVSTGAEPTRVDLTAGFNLLFDQGAVLRLTGDAKLGERYESYGANIKFSVPF